MACEPKQGAYQVEVDGQGCKACGYCREVCPREVFGQADYFNDKGYKPVEATAPENCIGCRRCFFACPDFAINIAKRPVKEDCHEKSI